MAEQNAKSTAPEPKTDPEEPLESTAEVDEDEERRAAVLRNGVTWESFEKFLRVFGKWYPGK